MEERLRLIEKIDIKINHQRFEKNSCVAFHAIALLIKQWIGTYSGNVVIADAIY